MSHPKACKTLVFKGVREFQQCLEAKPCGETKRPRDEDANRTKREEEEEGKI